MRLRLFASQAGLAIGVLAAVTIVSAEILPQTAGPVVQGYCWKELTNED